jgi:hypothetical protein
MYSHFGCYWPYVWHLIGLHIGPHLGWPLGMYGI